MWPRCQWQMKVCRNPPTRHVIVLVVIVAGRWPHQSYSYILRPYLSSSTGCPKIAAHEIYNVKSPRVLLTAEDIYFLRENHRSQGIHCFKPCEFLEVEFPCKVPWNFQESFLHGPIGGLIHLLGIKLYCLTC